MPAPRRKDLILAIRQAEARLRELGSTWDDNVPGLVRYEVLQVANALLAILLLIDSQ